MINLTNETDLIIDALKTKVETMTNAINESVNSNIDSGIVDLLKDKQNKLNDLLDQIENAIEEDDVYFALLTESEMEQLE
jgi:hypothetical protein